eukprot:4268316-Alexandrium_andersonii.AAC.1
MAFVRGRTQVARPLHEVVQRWHGLCARSYKGGMAFARGRTKGGMVFARGRTKEAGPSYEVVQRWHCLCTRSYNGGM